MKHFEHIRNRITQAFQKANDVHGVTGKVTPKQPATQASDLSTKQSHYTQTQADTFKRSGDELIGACLRSPHVKLHRHHAHAYYIGDLNKQPSLAQVITEIEERYTEPKERKKAS
jgi:hypothetical protein